MYLNNLYLYASWIGAVASWSCTRLKDCADESQRVLAQSRETTFPRGTHRLLLFSIRRSYAHFYSFSTHFLLIFYFLTGRLLQSLNSQASAGSTSPHSSIPVLPLVPQVDRPLPSSDCRLSLQVGDLHYFSLIKMAIFFSATKSRSIPVPHSGIERCAETTDGN